MALEEVKMNVLIFGRGAIGSQYGWALERAGHKVDFFVRRGRSKDYGDTVSLCLYDFRSRKQIEEKWKINLKEEIEEDKSYDLILLSVNPEQVEDALLQVKSFAKNAVVLFFCNYGLGVKELAKAFPDGQLVYGFPGAGGGYEGNSLCGVLYKFFQMGQSGKMLSEKEAFVKKLFTEAGFKVSIQKNIEEWLLNHYVANAAMEAEVLKAGSFKAVASSKKLLSQMVLNIREMTPYIKAKGFKPDALVKALNILPPAFVGSLMKNLVYKDSGPAYKALSCNHYKAGHSVMQIAKDAAELGIKTPRLQEALLV